MADRRAALAGPGKGGQSDATGRGTGTPAVVGLSPSRRNGKVAEGFLSYDEIQQAVSRLPAGALWEDRRFSGNAVRVVTAHGLTSHRRGPAVPQALPTVASPRTPASPGTIQAPLDVPQVQRRRTDQVAASQRDLRGGRVGHQDGADQGRAGGGRRRAGRAGRLLPSGRHGGGRVGDGRLKRAGAYYTT